MRDQLSVIFILWACTPHWDVQSPKCYECSSMIGGLITGFLFTWLNCGQKLDESRYYSEWGSVWANVTPYERGIFHPNLWGYFRITLILSLTVFFCDRWLTVLWVSDYLQLSCSSLHILPTVFVLLLFFSNANVDYVYTVGWVDEQAVTLVSLFILGRFCSSYYSIFHIFLVWLLLWFYIVYFIYM